MSYVDAGYALGLSVLCLYAVSLVVRRRRLERALGRSLGPGTGDGEPEAGSASVP